MFRFVLLTVLCSTTLAKPSGVSTVGQYSAPSYILLTSSAPQTVQQVTPLQSPAPVSGSLQLLSPTLTAAPVAYAAQQLQSIAPFSYARPVLPNLATGAPALAAPIASAPTSTILGIAAPTFTLQTVASSVPATSQQGGTVPALPATAYTAPGSSVGLLNVPTGAAHINLRYGPAVSSYATALPAGFASSTLW